MTAETDAAGVSNGEFADHAAAREWVPKYMRHTNPWGNLCRAYLALSAAVMALNATGNTHDLAAKVRELKRTLEP